jgi:hypothetical protein
MRLVVLPKVLIPILGMSEPEMPAFEEGVSDYANVTITNTGNTTGVADIYVIAPTGWVVENEKLHLVGSHCRKCGQNYFPSKDICPKCFAEENLK